MMKKLLINNIKTCIDQSNCCYFRTFDNKCRILSLQQFYKNNLHWEYVYTYTDTSRVGNFKTYNNDDFTKQEIVLYQNENIKQIEEFYTFKYGGMSKMKKYYCCKSGLIKKIEYYEAHGMERKYELEYYTDVKIKVRCKQTKQLVEQINEIILNETL